MSDMAMLEERLVGGFAYFLESGKTVDGDTVSASYFPDVDPTTNWLSAGEIEAVRFSRESNSQPKLVPLASGGYRMVQRESNQADYIDLVLHSYNEWVDRLQMGFSAEIVQGTEAAPFAALDRKITGAMKLQGRKTDGTDYFRMDVWVECRLIETPEWAAQYGKPVLRAQVMTSTLNSGLFPS